MWLVGSEEEVWMDLEVQGSELQGYRAVLESTHSRGEDAGKGEEGRRGEKEGGFWAAQAPRMQSGECPSKEGVLVREASIPNGATAQQHKQQLPKER